MGIEDFIVFTEQYGFDCRAARIEAEIARTAIGRQVCRRDCMLAMALLKFFEFLGVFE